MGVLMLLFFIIFIVLLYQRRMQANKTERANSEKDHQKKLLDVSLDVAEKERQKIAVNIHDEIGLSLSILKMHLSKLQKSKRYEEEQENIFSASYALIGNSIEIVRGIYNDIIPKTLMTMGLVASLKELAREINSSGEAVIKISCEEDVFVNDKNKELQLHRLIKEVLNNTLRHAKPAFIEINIENIENNLRLSILHDGMGITTTEIKKLAENSTGLGLKSIFMRIGILQANIEFLKEKDNKAKVIIDCTI